jgi:site-specific DNA-methyltransferase (adenine-specific)
MPHQSENARRLTVRWHTISNIAELPKPDSDQPGVWLFVLPHGRSDADADVSPRWIAGLTRFVRSLHPSSIVALLTTPADAAATWPHLSGLLKLQLWVAVKLNEPIVRSPGALPEHHAALLILSKYAWSLRHTKTRIAYTYCPACDRTTKDYGGKKHTYHAYGTLLSDVWRDMTYSPGRRPRAIATRLSDLFGLEPHRHLSVFDFQSAPELRPWARPSDGVSSRQKPPALLPSRLVRGDALRELRRLPSDSIDFCFADPPYNIDKRYDVWNDAIAASDYLGWCDQWLVELARVLRPGCTCAVLNIPAWAVRHFQQMKRLLTYQAWIAWEGLSLPVRMIMPGHYAIVCFSKGPARALSVGSLEALREGYCLRASCMRARRSAREPDHQPITDLWWDIHRLKHNSRRVDHPCQLPPALMRRLIALFTSPGEMVLDPFNGAGTTSLCAAALGRRYGGIELSSEYHALALRRHELLRDGGNPFDKTDDVPLSKNSRVRRAGGVRYPVPKKALQLEVRRVAEHLGRLPSRDELERHGRYPFRYYERYFVNWGEVCAAARTTGMSETRPSTVTPAR